MGHALAALVGHIFDSSSAGSLVLICFTVDPSSSSTFTTVAVGGFEIQYLDKTQSSGDYISDNFEIGGSLVSALQMGLALHSTVGVGIMGIGYQTDESVSAKNRYPNLVDQLVLQKFINLRAYSLYLDDKETSTGSVLFGGIDTEKFIGTLKVLPIQKNPRTNTINAFIVLMTSLSITENSGIATWTSSDISVPVVLDSGTTLAYLPADLVQAIISQLGAVDDTKNSNLTFVDCDWRTTRANDFLSFGFGGSDGPVIHVPLSEVIRTIVGYYPDSPFKNTCDLGIRAADISTYILGDTFLRSAYVVYDIDHNQIALAQTNFETPGSEVREIPSGATGIPLLAGQATGLTQVPQSHFTTSNTFSSSRTPSHLDTTATAEVTLYTMSGSTSSGGGGSAAMSTSTGISTSSSTPTSPSIQTATPTASSATSKSAAVRIVPACRKDGLAVLFVSTLVTLAGGFWFLLL
jgi:hypothetical protein